MGRENSRLNWHTHFVGGYGPDDSGLTEEGISCRRHFGSVLTNNP